MRPTPDAATDPLAYFELGELGEDETTVRDLILWVHATSCNPDKPHSRFCNTMRLVAHDQRSLDAKRKEVHDLAAEIAKRT